MALPLEGIRVLDMSRAQQGPYAGVMLADLGADVVKVESPTGDFARGALLAWYPEGTIDAYQLAHNRGKRSLAVNFFTEKGREIVLKLASRCDVFLHNFRPGVTNAIGLGYEEVNRRNPRIIYCNVSGYGRNSPLSRFPAFDLIGQAMGGIMSVTGDPEGPPTPVGAAIADQVGAMMAAFGIVVALLVRERTGIGQEVDESMLDTQLAIQTWEITHYLVTGLLPAKGGRGHGLLRGLWQTFHCGDGKYIAIAGTQQERWPGFCRAVGRSEWVDDPRFDTAEHREQNRPELLSLLDKLFLEKTAQEWLERLRKEDQVASPVCDYAEITAHPHVVANEMVVTVTQQGQEARTVGFPVKLSKTPAKVRRGYPRIGEHSEEILLELGYTWEDILRFKEEGIVP